MSPCLFGLTGPAPVLLRHVPLPPPPFSTFIEESHRPLPPVDRRRLSMTDTPHPPPPIPRLRLKFRSIMNDRKVADRDISDSVCSHDVPQQPPR